MKKYITLRLTESEIKIIDYCLAYEELTDLKEAKEASNYIHNLREKIKSQTDKALEIRKKIEG